MPATRDTFDHLRKEQRMTTYQPRSYGTGLAAYRKTLAGVLTPVVTYAASRWLLGFPPEAIAPLVGVLTGVAVWATPNKLISKSYGN